MRLSSNFRITLRHSEVVFRSKGLQSEILSIKALLSVLETIKITLIIIFESVSAEQIKLGGAPLLRGRSQYHVVSQL